MKSILLIEDDASFRITMAQVLKGRGYRPREASSPREALASIEDEGAPDGIVLDMRLGNASGKELIPALRSRCPGSRLVVLTGYGNIPEAMEALRLGADDYLLKPAGLSAILAALHKEAGEQNRPAPDEAPPSLARVEWEHIQRILHDCGGNISHAAERLGIDRRTLQRKLAKQPPEV